ncbi:hypothetical protein QW131_14120 [Roseibium salinum]|nr:hypothetical protein [Roseibium salinum]
MKISVAFASMSSQHAESAPFFAQDPGLFLNLLGRFQNRLGCPFGLRDDGIEFQRGVGEAVVRFLFRLHIGDFRLGALDRFVHVGDVEADLVEIRHFPLAGDDLLEPLNRGQDLGRFRRLSAPEKLSQKPTSAIGFHQGLFKSLVFGFADQLRFFLYCFRFHMDARSQLA